ncbi:MAG TPA: hypothetical protein VJB13_02875 [Candidatus Nanoarchaeia archaeon]|nr:hypothetical protein [Candidatus Nanoarchaeia archaeon]
MSENKGYHDLEFLRAYVLKAKDHTYLATPPANDYVIQRQRGSLEGLAENLHRLNDYGSKANTSYSRTGTYDLASKLGLYNPVTSYSPPRNLYHKDQYQ